MNERIKELYGNALDKAVPYTWHNLDHIEVEKIMKEFAELIVRECYDTIKKDMELAHIQLIPIDFGIYANGRLRRIMKEHFGVKE